MAIKEAKTASETAEFILRHIVLGNALGNAFLSARDGTEYFNGATAIQLESRGPDEFHSTVVEVTQETPLAVTERLHRESEMDVCVLNFGDACRAGGLLFEGAVANEETFCRATGLYYCLKGHELYEQNTNKKNLVEGDAFMDLLYSSEVPVLRDSTTENLLDEESIYSVSVLTSPIVRYRTAASIVGTETEEKLQERILRILRLLSNKRKKIVVVGSVGKDPEMLAKTFNDELNTTFRNHFKKVVFAVHERTSTRNLTAFQTNINMRH